MLEISKRFAQTRRLRSALEAASQAYVTIDFFLICVASWEVLDPTAPGLSLSLISAVLDVFGWQRPVLGTLAKQIAEAGAGSNLPYRGL
jgi:hypothetical protein